MASDDEMSCVMMLKLDDAVMHDDAALLCVLCVCVCVCVCRVSRNLMEYNWVSN